MKKVILSLLMMLALAVGTEAQEARQRVFQQIHDKAYIIANDSKEAMSVRKLAIFRVDAVNYLSTKTLTALTDTTKHLSQEEITQLNDQLDSMAYFMYDYENLFNKEYTRARTEKQKQKIIKIFRDVSINNPLYNDPDRQLVLAYYNREDFLTQFSLDTNWVKAVSEVKERLKEN
ncbi:MAG: hypothetical protein PUG12_04750 [Prevotella sp.]|nr:hypothetical protein [Prevotella sp.]